MSDIENFDYFKIDIADIWFCERLYFFSKEKDFVFASKLLEKTQSSILKYGKPAFGKEMRTSNESYYELQYTSYVKSLDTLENQFAIDFFFIQEKCYLYNNPVIIKRNNLDYEFWFTLKLRQYDGKLSDISNFLKFQLKTNFSKNFSKFSMHIKMCIRQYPELLTSRVIETTNEWINNIENAPIKEKRKRTVIALGKLEKTNKKKIDIKFDKKGPEKTNLKTKNKAVKKSRLAKIKQNIKDKNKVVKKAVLDATKSKKQSTTSNAKKTLTHQPNKKEKSKPSITEFSWIEKNPELKSKQLVFLREQLIDNDYIDKINLIKFEAHFNGKISDSIAINWLKGQFPLIYLIDKLKPFLNELIYTGKNNTISISKFAPHFTWQGNQIHIPNWAKVKATSHKSSGIIYKSIDMIIKNLRDIT